jgi:hypothetical protein
MMSLILEPLAAQLIWSYEAPKSLEEVDEIIKNFMGTITKRCSAKDHYVIGHIKGLSLFPEGGYLRCSAISETQPVDLEIAGDVPNNLSGFPFTLNIIVYGLPFHQARKIVIHTADDLSTQYGVSITIESVSNPEQESHQHG